MSISWWGDVTQSNKEQKIAENKHWKPARIQLFRQIRAALEKHAIEHWIDSGTLLGAWRDKGMIPHDSDTDIAIPGQQMHQAAEQALGSSCPTWDSNMKVTVASWRCTILTHQKCRGQRNVASGILALIYTSGERMGGSSSTSTLALRTIAFHMNSSFPWGRWSLRVKCVPHHVRQRRTSPLCTAIWGKTRCSIRQATHLCDLSFKYSKKMWFY